MILKAQNAGTSLVTWQDQLSARLLCCRG